MRRDSIITVATASFLFLTQGVVSAQTNQSWSFRYPHRLIENSRIDLSPLFTWWTNVQTLRKDQPQGSVPPRPWVRWVKLAGTNVGTVSLGSVVEGEIEEFPGKANPAKIVLRHPPGEEQRFEQLKAASADLLAFREHARITSDMFKSSANRYGQKASVLDTVRYADPSLNRRLQPRALDYGHRASAEIDRSHAASHAMSNADVERSLIDEELETIPHSGNTYRLEFFIYRTGQTFHGMPVYDLGRFVK